MKIKKYAHSCLLVEVNGVRIITDPGKWNETPNTRNIDAVVITHEHADHCDVGQLKEIVAGSPTVRIITHSAVAKILDEAGIAHELIEPGVPLDVRGVSVESFGTEHAIIYGDVSPCRNTGYLINGELFAPGDALHDVPSSRVRILALPTGGPWMKMSEAIDYTKKVKPEIVFPIHDGMYTEEFRADLPVRHVTGNVQSLGITFVDMPPGAEKEF